MRYISRRASFSKCYRYRYRLSRVWRNPHQPKTALFVGLNPSTADALSDDPTLRRIVNLADTWGFDGVAVANIFAWRCTDPDNLPRDMALAVGPQNNRAIRQLASRAEKTFVCWGNRCPLERERVVTRLLPAPLYCLGLTRQGRPRHPLYVPASTQARLWELDGSCRNKHSVHEKTS